ncbi:MAG: STAS domain-containing protein [Desulfobulbaceae bacterium]|nr:MAG: STAS domain-containing protein [Desulfobulbaceae bacterium]
MLLKVTDHPEATIIHIKGRLDSATAPELESQVLSSLEGGRQHLVLDFSELEYINSAGLRILVLGYQRLHPLGGQVMVCGVKDYIAEVFDISGYNRVFRMCPDLDQAIRYLSAPPDGQ